MWAIFNRTPYAVERNWTRDKEGMHWWLVAVKAGFDIGPNGRLKLADEQPPPLLAPEYFEEPGKSSLRYDSDLLAAKPSTDVLVLANAHAPGGRPAAIVPVAIRVGALKKELLVHGERIYYRGLLGPTTTTPQPFLTRPIQYELAFGGSDLADPDASKHRIDERNPIGRGFARQVKRLVNQPAHAIEYLSGDPSTKGPAGFGPIDAAWSPRRQLAGTYDEAWARTKKPLLPDDYDPAFALSAPADQRLPQPLMGGERIGLLNLTREGTLVFDLPRIVLEFTSRFGKKRRPHPALLATVLVEPEARRLSLVWQSVLRVAASEADYLDATEVIEQRSSQ